MIRQSRKEAVVLLHGLAANRLVMTRLSRFLQDRGYQVENWGYRSTRGSIESHARDVYSALSKFVSESEYEAVHFVTHSLGGIVARRALELFRPPNLGRMVMLGPPNHGSHVARQLAKPLGRFCYALRQLSDAPGSYVNELAEPDGLDVGVVAAAEDRVVRLASTMLSCQRDHIVLPGHHGMLPWRRNTADQVVHFLEYGSFDHTCLAGGEKVRQVSNVEGGAAKNRMSPGGNCHRSSSAGNASSFQMIPGRGGTFCRETGESDALVVDQNRLAVGRISGYMTKEVFARVAAVELRRDGELIRFTARRRHHVAIAGKDRVGRLR